MLQRILIYAAGALVVLAGNTVLRAAVIKALEPAGKRLDRWRRQGVEPERDLALLLGNFLIVFYVAGFAERYQLPAWAFYLLAVVWMLHLPRDLANWLRNRGRSPAALHRRGFFLFHYGPLWLRTVWALLSLLIGVGLETAGVDVGHIAVGLLSKAEDFFQ